MEKASRVVLAAQYTGANGAEVLAMCQAITQYSGNVWSVDADDGQVLRLKETSPSLAADWPILKTQWVVVAPDTGIIARMTPAAYAARYRAIDTIVADAVASTVQPLVAAEVAKAMYGGFGVTGLPLLTPNATSAPIPVTIEPVQPDTGYVARAFAVSGAAVLTSLSIVSITKTSGTVATVVVKNNGAASVGGLLLLHITSPVGGASTP